MSAFMFFPFKTIFSSVELDEAGDSSFVGGVGLGLCGSFDVGAQLVGGVGLRMRGFFKVGMK